MKYKHYVMKGHYEHILPRHRDFYAENIYQIVDITHPYYSWDDEDIATFEEELEKFGHTTIGDFDVYEVE